MVKAPSLDELRSCNETLEDTIKLLVRRRGTNDGVLEEAAKYYEGMQANLNPLALLCGRLWAWRTIHFSFAGMDVRGFDKVEPFLRQGKAVIVPTHLSYFDLPPVIGILTGNGRNYYIGGDNVVKVSGEESQLSFMSKSKAEFAKWLLINMGLVRIKREISEDNDVLKAQLLIAYDKAFTRQGINQVILSGVGRSRDGQVHPYKSILNRMLIGEASAIVPLGITHDTIPEDWLFVHKVEQKQASIHTVSPLQRWDMRYGRIHAVFGDPIIVSNYPAPTVNGRVPTTNIARLERAVTEALYKLMTLTPANLLSVVIPQASREFIIAEVSDTAMQICDAAIKAGINVAPQLANHKTGFDFANALEKGAKRLAWRGALEYIGIGYKVKDAPMVRYYANSIRPTLRAFTVA